MLKLVDTLVRDLLVDQVPALVTAAQVRFQPPDAALRTDVVNLNRLVLDVYLVELREHRSLRSNGRDRSLDHGIVLVEQAPERVDCHYLLSAWSPAQPAPGIEPTLDEHALLYDAMASLLLAGPLNPSRVYPPASAKLAAWPARFRDDDLPTNVVPGEGFLKLSDFWTSMGQDSRWKPVVYLVVTVPVAMLSEVAGPMVTTLMTEHRLSDAPDDPEALLIQIGGHVLNAKSPLPDGSPSPVAGAWVQLERTTGEVVARTTTSELGRFTFGWLREGTYQLRASAPALGALAPPPTAVPSPSGKYDLLFP